MDITWTDKNKQGQLREQTETTRDKTGTTRKKTGAVREKTGAIFPCEMRVS